MPHTVKGPPGCAGCQGAVAMGTGHGSRPPHEEAAAAPQAKDNGGLAWKGRRAWPLEGEPAGLAAGLGVEKREWSAWLGT